MTEDLSIYDTNGEALPADPAASLVFERFEDDVLHRKMGLPVHPRFPGYLDGVSIAAREQHSWDVGNGLGDIDFSEAENPDLAKAMVEVLLTSARYANALAETPVYTGQYTTAQLVREEANEHFRAVDRLGDIVGPLDGTKTTVAA